MGLNQDQRRRENNNGGNSTSVVDSTRIVPLQEALELHVHLQDGRELPSTPEDLERLKYEQMMQLLAEITLGATALVGKNMVRLCSEKKTAVLFVPLADRTEDVHQVPGS